MLSTTVVHACPRGGSERLQKNGHTVGGAQRARCLECRRTFTLSPKGPRYSEQVQAQVLAAYQGSDDNKYVQSARLNGKEWTNRGSAKAI